MVHQQPRRDFNFVGHGNFSCSVWSCLLSSVSLGDKRGLSLGELIRPFCITILYHNLLLVIDIFHIGTQYLCYFIYFACFIIIGGSSTGARILLEKAPSERNISEDQLWKGISRKFLFFQMTEPAKRGGRGGPPWALPMGRRGHQCRCAATWGGGPRPPLGHRPFAYFISQKP